MGKRVLQCSAPPALSEDTECLTGTAIRTASPPPHAPADTFRVSEGRSSLGPVLHSPHQMW